MELYPKFLAPSVIIANNYKLKQVDLSEKPQPPQKILPLDERKDFFSTSVVLIVIILFISFLNMDLLGIGIFISIILSLYKMISTGIRSEEYNQKLKEVEKKYDQEYSIYSKKEEIYNNALKLQNKLNHYLKTEEPEIAKILILRELYKEKKVQIFDSKEIKEGYSEKIFYEFLKSEFGVRIQKGKGIIAEGYSKNYFPDFIYIDKVRQIFIDIEIDEPYDLTTGLPIHTEGQDKIRDDFFISINWSIIRFSENQIIKDAPNCIKTIKKIVQILENGQLEWESFVFREPSWDEKKAIELEKIGFRESCLGIKKIERIKIINDQPEIKKVESENHKKSSYLYNTPKNIDFNDFDDDLPF